MKIKKDKGIYLRITQKELEYINILKNKHYINISAFFRESLDSLYNKLENKNE